MPDSSSMGRVARPYDAALILSFGGPEKPDDVIPFLENVLRGRNVPRERMLEVAEHYYLFGGKSPINDQNRELAAALERELRRAGPDLPVFWGNRNWHPLLADTLREMRDAGVKRAVTYVTSAFSSYSGCRQYREDIERARAAVDGAPELDKLRVFYNHPAFIACLVERMQQALSQIPADRRAATPVLFTAHSVPMSMANSSDYVQQLNEACRLVAEGAGLASWRLAYQSRSGPPGQPWLEPDVGDLLRAMPAGSHVAISPIGFISDHMEVLYDLDTEAKAVCEQAGIHMVRVGTVGAHPAFVGMIGELIRERMGLCQPRAIGRFGPNHDVCPADCCPAPARRPSAAETPPESGSGGPRRERTSG